MDRFICIGKYNYSLKKENMAKKNAIDNKSGELTIDPGASGDSFVQFNINTTGEFRIGVDDTDDSFRMSQGSALGTNDTFIMTASGERTMPLQPAFLAYNSVTDANVTGDGTTITVEFDTEAFDQGGDYDNTADTFTAPITGKYIFSTNVYLQGFNGTQTSYQLDVITSNGTFTIFLGDPTNLEAGGEVVVNGCIIADMDANDTTTISLVAGGGDLTVDVRGASDRRTQFSGALLV